MRAAGYLLIAAALITGALAATGAYLLGLDAPEPLLRGQVLNASAGVIRDPEETLLEAARQRGPGIAAAMAAVRTRRQLEMHLLIGSGDREAAMLAAGPETGVVAVADRARAERIASLDELDEPAALYLVCLGMEPAELEQLEATARQAEQPMRVVAERGRGVLLPLPVPPAAVERLGENGEAELAYLSLLTLPDRQLQQARVEPRAGRLVLPNDQPLPLVTDDVRLTASLIPRLRQAGVEHVRVKSFHGGQWTGRWAFALAVVGLLAGAGLLRRDAARQERSAAQQAGHAAAQQPEEILRQVAQVLHQTWHQAQQTEQPARRLQRIAEQLGQLQREPLMAFAESRPQLIAQFGLTGFAELMDRFAAAERQVNRAWSTATDGVHGDALEALDLARQRMDAALQWIGEHREEAAPSP